MAVSTHLGSSTCRVRDVSPTLEGARTSAAAKPALAFELLESKLRPPQGRVGTVSRGTLISALESSRAAPVVFASAGPGWGKTTLLAQWAEHSERPFAWVGVDENDNDPIVLLTYVAVALDRVARLDPRVFDSLGSPGVSVEASVVPRLGAALATIGQPVVLVLDDLHLVDNPAALDAVATLARHVPEGSQLALSARGEPALPLGALRARGLTMEIGPDDLRMDEAEARQLVSAAGLELADEQIAVLTARTEGWSAGLYLAALSITARGIDVKKAAAFSGSDRLLSDYLRSELLAHLSLDVFRFLTRTAVLGRMSGPLCDAVLEEGGSARVLDSLARSNLFLVPLDAKGGWYRYHHLFQELLRAELMRAEPELVCGLLVRASDWCEANGQPETAIGYAQEAGEVARVARLVERWGQPVYQSGRVATVERWLDWLDRHGALHQNAAVAVLGSLIAAVQGRPGQAERWAEVAERASYDGMLYDGSASIDSWLALLSAIRCRRGVARMRADAELAVRTLARGSQFWPTALLLLALSHRLAGELDEADDLLADVAGEGLALGAPEAVVVALGERAALAIGRGAWVQAEELVERAALVVRRARLEEYPTSAFVYVVAARVALHRGEAERAQELLTEAQRLRARLTYALPYLAVQTRLELALAYLTIADAGGARTMLREIDALLRRRPDLGTLSAQVEDLRSSLKTMRSEAPGASTLTTAELRVIPYLGTHLSFREIGERLFISRHTVKSHAISIYRKLSVTSRNSAVERARGLGLL
jgi:LuxR family maltose regulon positive regulatory protein